MLLRLGRVKPKDLAMLSEIFTHLDKNEGGALDLGDLAVGSVPPKEFAAHGYWDEIKAQCVCVLILFVSFFSFLLFLLLFVSGLISLSRALSLALPPPTLFLTISPPLSSRALSQIPGLLHDESTARRPRLLGRARQGHRDVGLCRNAS
jgi:hypothetical protein